MGALWSPDEFIDGGLKSITKIQGVLVDLEEDVEGVLPNGDTTLQIRLDFENVEILEATDETARLVDGEFTAYMKQSARKNSVNKKAVTDWVAFAKKENVGPVPTCFIGKEMIWEQATYQFGEGMTPGKAFIPVAFINGSGPADIIVLNEAVIVPDDLFAAIKEVTGADGATRDMIRSVLVKKKTTREQLTASGGMDAILASLVTAEKLIESDDLFIVA